MYSLNKTNFVPDSDILCEYMYVSQNYSLDAIFVRYDKTQNYGKEYHATQNYRDSCVQNDISSVTVTLHKVFLWFPFPGINAPAYQI